MTRTNRAGVVGLQHRVTLDADMGELYAWLRAKAPSARPREMLYLMRLGFEVHCGRLHDLHLDAAAAALGPASAPARGAEAGAHPGVGFTRGFDLGSLCNPSLPE